MDPPDKKEILSSQQDIDSTHLVPGKQGRPTLGLITNSALYKWSDRCVEINQNGHLWTILCGSIAAVQVLKVLLFRNIYGWSQQYQYYYDIKYLILLIQAILNYRWLNPRLKRLHLGKFILLLISYGISLTMVINGKKIFVETWMNILYLFCDFLFYVVPIIVVNLVMEAEFRSLKAKIPSRPQYSPSYLADDDNTVVTSCSSVVLEEGQSHGGDRRIYMKQLLGSYKSLLTEIDSFPDGPGLIILMNFLLVLEYFRAALLQYGMTSLEFSSVFFSAIPWNFVSIRALAQLNSELLFLSDTLLLKDISMRSVFLVIDNRAYHGLVGGVMITLVKFFLLDL